MKTCRIVRRNNDTSAYKPYIALRWGSCCAITAVHPLTLNALRRNEDTRLIAHKNGVSGSFVNTLGLRLPLRFATSEIDHIISDGSEIAFNMHRRKSTNHGKLQRPDKQEQ